MKTLLRLAIGAAVTAAIVNMVRMMNARKGAIFLEPVLS
jgi:hypothetical protein